MIKKDDGIIEKIYAGWLGKLIGVRSGAPIEMWTAEEIAAKYGVLDGYPEDYKNFGADDDSNGNIYALRTFYDNDCAKLASADFGRNILNNAPFEHGYFWWGGYGVSEEHTAYLNMCNGVMPPDSGSIKHNGRMLAEQIGGQIFSDIYGLLCPGDCGRAADLAEKASRVMHDGEAVFGGRFVAACISAAFTERAVDGVIARGLSVIPQASEYAKTVNAVSKFYSAHPEDYGKCLAFIRENFWKDKFGGNCHIIPNAAIMILALRYGGGDFDKSVNICNRCGFDTDCNTSNIATMLGVLNGLDGINYNKWRKPINDITVGSSVIGALNIVDAADFAFRLAEISEKLSGAEFDTAYAESVRRPGVCGFELPGSTHGFESDAELSNTRECAYTGRGALKIVAGVGGGKVYKRTYYRASEMYDNRYDPAFSPLIYPGQTIKCFVRGSGRVSLYAKDCNSGVTQYSAAVDCGGLWQEIAYTVPADGEGRNISEIGLTVSGGGAVYMDDFSFGGTPSYKLDFSREITEDYSLAHKEVSQCTYHKGYWRLEDGMLSGSCADGGELYTGGLFGDINLKCSMLPAAGERHKILFCVQGAMRGYAVGFDGAGRLVLEKNAYGYATLAERGFLWKHDEEYLFEIDFQKGKICISVNGVRLITFDDSDPYLSGGFGAAVQNGSRARYKYFIINKN
ncbi:MAG: ADP-ribosylglycohydrolase family protein [Clostridiales bacterium]|jgi:ADP-ribosylglycohydrolase|nr:ADP-ribosylglycohydrolase family protein [Clostridiales bacterium]